MPEDILPKIKVAITEDHPMTAKGIRETLLAYPSIEVIGSYAAGNDLLLALETMVPDVLLLDLQLPDTTGDRLARIISSQYPAVRILVLSNFDSPIYISKLVGHDVAGYLLKTSDEARLIEAITAVHNGQQYLEPGIREKLEQLSAKRYRSQGQKTSLTPKEKEVLQLIVEGEGSAAIAERLFLSPHTVNNYRNNLLLKLNAKNMADLVAKALKEGLAY